MGHTALLLLLSAAAASAATCPVALWDPAAPFDGALVAGDCRLTDLIPARTETNVARQIAFDVTANGIYTFDVSSVEFDTILLLTDARFQPIGLDNDTTRNDSRVVAHLTPESYYLFVISNRGAGAFNIRMSFAERTGCTIRELDGGGTIVNGQLGTGTCRVFETVAPSASALLGDPYHFRVDQPRVLTVALQARAIDPFLALVDAKTGQVIATDDDSLDGFNALLIQSVAPGEYYVIATLSGGTSGAYAIQSRLDAPRNCETRDIKPGDSASGQLTEPDCRLLDVVAGSDDDSRLDIYRIELTDPGVLTVEVSSGNFPPGAFLLSSEGKLLGTALSPAVSQSAKLTLSLKPGRYQIGASHAQLSAGTYQLRTSLEPVRGCQPETLAPETTAAGSLSAADCRYLDVVLPETSTTPLKPYRLTIEKRSQVTIDMTSPQIDTFLVVLDATGKAIASDDNSGGFTNARLVLTLNPGTYTVLAASNQSGPFELLARVAEPKSCPAVELSFSDAVSGDLAADDCTIRDLISEDARSVAADFYTVTLAEPGTLTVDLSSASFVPALILTGADRRSITSDEPAANSLGAAHIRRQLPAGTYGIVATASGGRAGSYSLRAGFRK